MIVPLATRGHTLGTITLVMSAESGRHYTEADLALAEELARRAALAVDNARLYAEAQQLNAQLEDRVVQRTAELQAAIAQLENSRAQVLLLARHERISREEDRARMAREVHDQLGQALTGLKMDLAWLQKHTGPKQKDLQQKFRDMSHLVDTTIQDVRRIATELRPGMLDDLDWCRRWSGSCRTCKSAAGFAASSLRVWRRWRWTPRKPPSFFASCRRP